MEIDLGSSTNLYWDFGILIFINFLLEYDSKSYIYDSWQWDGNQI